MQGKPVCTAILMRYLGCVSPTLGSMNYGKYSDEKIACISVCKCRVTVLLLLYSSAVFHSVRFLHAVFFLFVFLINFPLKEPMICEKQISHFTFQ